MRDCSRTGLPLLVALALAACSESADPPRSDPPSDPRLIVEDGAFRDVAGRRVTLRGVNARVAGLFDVTFDDGRTALEPIPTFGADDCRFVSKTLGMNLLRLPVNWSGIEPTRGEYDPEYLDAVVALVNGCAEHGVYVLVDLHQDAYSKHIGEDGAPLWAIVPPPDALLEGPLDDLAARRVSGQVVRSFASFFQNAEGIQDAYAEMAAVLAQRVADRPNVVGLEIMNEPVVPNDPTLLDPFHALLAERIRAAAPDLPLFFEPDAVRNFLDRAPVRAPFPDPNSAYAPHVYTGVFSGTWTPDAAGKLEASIDAAEVEASEHGSALLVGEFGHDPRSELGRQWLDVALRRMDVTGISWALWLYEERSQGQWGLFDAVDEETRGDVREDVVAWVARPFVAASPGGAGWVYEPDGEVLTVDLTAGGAVTLGIPAHVYAGGAVATCDGNAVAVELQPGRADLVCDGARLLVRGR